MKNGHKPSEAYLTAGYSANGTPEYVKTEANKLLKRPAVAEEIERRKAELASNYGIDHRWIVERLMEIAGVNLQDFHKLNGNLPEPDFSNADRRKWSGLSEVSTDQVSAGKDSPVLITKVKVKTHDRTAALKLLAQMSGMLQPKALPENTNVQVVGGLPQEDE